MLHIIVLAIVQGIAEFLPISSSGHLVVLGSVLRGLGGSPEVLNAFAKSATLEIILHAGTLGSILVVYYRRIIDLLVSDRRVIGLLVLGTIPAAVVGLTIKAVAEDALKSTPLVGFLLLVTGAMLVLLGRLQPRSGDYPSLGWGGVLVVGCFQALAVLPGVSRSGSTILGGRLVGLNKEDSVTFSFLLAIPAICGAIVLAMKDVISDGPGPLAEHALALGIGTAVSFGVGIFALKWLVQWSREDRLHWFAYWCIPAGLLTLGMWWAELIA